MASGVGTASLAFGATATQKTSVVVTGQTGIGGSDHVEAWFMADSTGDYNAEEHILASRLIRLTCGNVVAGTGFTVYAESELLWRGTFTIHWVWSS